MGWGPWSEVALARTVDWGFRLQLSCGAIRRHFPCLVSHPFDEERRHRFVVKRDELEITSYTSRAGAFNGNPNQAVVIEILARPHSELRFAMNAPVEASFVVPMQELASRSIEGHT